MMKKEPTEVANGWVCGATFCDKGIFLKVQSSIVSHRVVFHNHETGLRHLKTQEALHSVPSVSQGVLSNP